MKSLKKMMALVIAMVMALALGTTVFASDYKITIDNSSNTSVSINGTQYTAYKLFDVTYTGSNTTDPHAYSIDSDGDGAWAWNTIKGTKNETTGVYTNSTYGLTFTPTAADPTVYSITSTMTDEQARALADVLGATSVSKTGAVSASATGGSDEKASIDVGEPGYWLVYGTAKAKDQDTADTGDETVVAACALTTTDPAETVIPKVSIPTLDKKITGEIKLDEAGKAASAQVGSTVNFELDSVVPDIRGYSEYTFTITDTMSSGLTFTTPSDVVVKVNDVDKTSDATINVNGQTLTITIPKDKLATYTAGQAIVVTYSAIVNEGALTTNYEKNTASLEYSNNPYDTTSKEKTPDKTVYVIDVDIDVDKVKKGDDTTKLDGAEFVLFKGTTQPADTAEAWYKWDETNKKVTWVARANADKFTTVTGGALDKQIQGLEASETGTAYGLLETKAPTGYNLMADPTIVTLTSTYDGTANKVTVTASAGTVSNGTIDFGTAATTAEASDTLDTVKIENATGTELPSTGGIGTTIFYVIGAILVLGAGILLVNRRRMNAN